MVSISAYLVHIKILWPGYYQEKPEIGIEKDKILLSNYIYHLFIGRSIYT